MIRSASARQRVQRLCRRGCNRWYVQDRGTLATGSGKLKLAGRVNGATNESINRAFSYMLTRKGELSIAREMEESDLHVEVIDLMHNRAEGQLGLAFFVAAFSALKKAPAIAATLIMGDLSVQGNLKGGRTLVEPLQVGMDNGATRALIPLENKRSFMEVTADEHVDPVFFGDPKTAALKSFGTELMRRPWLMATSGALTALLFAGSVSAQDLTKLIGMASLYGDCERLVAAGNNFSDNCNGIIVQSIFETGRTGFTVTVGDKGVVMTFSGMEGAKPDADSQLQSLDKVILNLGIEGVPPTSTEVTGSCAYSNPYLGPMTISCQGEDPKGEAYLLQFRTDGSEPNMTDLSDTTNKSAEPSTRDFSVGAWTGGPLEGDPDQGCLMTKEVNSKIMLMVYANGNEAFDLNLYNKDWSFDAEQQVDADLLFDGTTFPLSGVEVRNPNLLTLLGGGEEEGFQSPFEASSELVLRMGREQITVDLAGSSAATAVLWSCVGR